MNTAKVIPMFPPEEEPTFHPTEEPTPTGPNRWLYTPKGPDPMRQGSALMRRLQADTELYRQTGGPSPHQADEFLQVCRNSLWGSEDMREFGEMLYGILEAFRPRNRWEMELLANVADVQWKIRRTRRLQQGVYDSGPHDRDAMGVAQRTRNASSFTESLDSLQKQLKKAIETYKRSRM